MDDKTDIADMKSAELKVLLKERGLSIKGKVDGLRKRLQEAVDQDDAEMSDVEQDAEVEAEEQDADEEEDQTIVGLHTGLLDNLQAAAVWRAEFLDANSVGMGVTLITDDLHSAKFESLDAAGFMRILKVMVAWMPNLTLMDGIDYMIAEDTPVELLARLKSLVKNVVDLNQMDPVGYPITVLMVNSDFTAVNFAHLPVPKSSAATDGSKPGGVFDKPYVQVLADRQAATLRRAAAKAASEAKSKAAKLQAIQLRKEKREAAAAAVAAALGAAAADAKQKKDDASAIVIDESDKVTSVTVKTERGEGGSSGYSQQDAKSNFERCTNRANAARHRVALRPTGNSLSAYEAGQSNVDFKGALNYKDPCSLLIRNRYQLDRTVGQYLNAESKFNTAIQLGTPASDSPVEVTGTAVQTLFNDMAIIMGNLNAERKKVDLYLNRIYGVNGPECLFQGKARTGVVTPLRENCKKRMRNQ